MYIDFDNYEFRDIVKDILNNREFKKLENYKHHSTSRLDHSIRVSFYAYKICKKFNLDYISAARGGLLHDFFMNRYCDSGKKDLLVGHPEIALYNSLKHFELNDKEMDIIRSHMFPVNMKVIPKYKESYIITFIDKVACIYERFMGCKCVVDFKVGRIMIYMFLLLTSKVNLL